MAGNNVSHANNKTSGGSCRICTSAGSGWKAKTAGVKLRVSNKGLRIIDKLGLDQVLSEMRARGVKI